MGSGNPLVTASLRTGYTDCRSAASRIKTRWATPQRTAPPARVEPALLKDPESILKCALVRRQLQRLLALIGLQAQGNA